MNIKNCTDVSGRAECKKAHWQLTMGFFTQMKGSARNVCTFFNVH